MSDPPAMKRPPMLMIGMERGLRACGHEDDFKILKGEFPEFAARRREKWNAKRCPACVAADQKKSAKKPAAAQEAQSSVKQR